MSTLASYFERLKIQTLKTYAGALDDISLSEYLSSPTKKPDILREPVPHVVIDDFFLPEVYKAMEDVFTATLARGFSETSKDRSKFHTFDMDYDGYKFTPKIGLGEGDPFRIFYSVAYNRYFSDLFEQQTTLTTSFAFHHHPPGDRTGFVHHDFVDKYFDIRLALPNLVTSHGANSIAQGQERWYFKEKRIIALLFYLANGEWHDGDGGETGMYAADQKTLITKIPPKNNRLFAFQISSKSYHAFQGNRTPRNCIVQWFHLPDNAF